MDIPSVSNRKLTLIRKLNQKKYRQKEQLFLLEGARAVEQVLQNRAVKVEALYFDEEQQYWLQEKWKKYLREYNGCSIPADQYVDVTDTDNPQGVLALCRMPEEVSMETLGAKKGIIVALDGVQDPGNLGTIIRTASWFGAVGLLSGKGTVDLFHPKVVRSTAGSTGVLPHRNGDLGDMLPQLEKAGWPVYLLDAGRNAKSLSGIHKLEKAIIVVGNEAHGVDPKLAGKERLKVRIDAPETQNGVESLNAAVATSIALYDFSGKLVRHNKN